jgi:hypothetical protein
MEQTMYSILVVGLVGDTAEVSTSFLGGLLRLQQKLAVTKNTSVAFEFCENVKSAIEYFMSRKMDRLVLIDGLMGVEGDWILKRHPVDEVVPAYPLREVHWETVSKKRDEGVTDPDRLRRASYRYNFTVDHHECEMQSYLKARQVQAKIVSLSRDACDSFLKRYCPFTKTLESSTVDVSAKVQNAGPFDFVGCVGSRLLSNVTKEV